jgi:hypothetical protein
MLKTKEKETMKSLAFVAVLAFSLFGPSYGHKKYEGETSPVSVEREAQVEDINFLAIESSLWLGEMPAESCNITDQYGSCSVTCSGKKKARCVPGYELRTGPLGTKKVKIPPRCYCT